MKRLDERVSVAGQIMPADIPSLAKAGFTTIINNRPDDEEPGQPAGAALEAAAHAAGLAYRHIPVASGFSAGQVEAMSSALADADGPVLAFCRSGTRSTFLWALARAHQGEDSQELMRKAAAAGYDLTPLLPYLR